MYPQASMASLQMRMLPRAGNEAPTSTRGLEMLFVLDPQFGGSVGGYRLSFICTYYVVGLYTSGTGTTMRRQMLERRSVGRQASLGDHCCVGHPKICVRAPS